MSKNQTLEEMRIEFDRAGGRTLAFPMAGTITWTAIAICGSFLPEDEASIALFICNGLIFPLNLLIARFRHEAVLGTTNELDRLFGRSVLMINLIWTIAIPFWMVYPSSLPLSVGIMAGLHWIIYGWIVNHWIGIFHTVTRTILILLAWFLFPDQRFLIIPIVIVIIYLITIYVLFTRPLNIFKSGIAGAESNL